MPDYVFQFAHVSGPGVAAKQNLRPLHQTAHVFFVLLRKLLYKVTRQQRQIIYPFAPVKVCGFQPWITGNRGLRETGDQ